MLSGFQLIASDIAASTIVFLSLRVHASRPFIFLWGMMSTLFIYLALDDMLMLHERVGFVLNRWTGLHGAYESFNWLLYFTPFIVVGIFTIALAVRTLFLIDIRTRIWALCGFTGFLLTLIAEAVGGYLLRIGAIPLYHLSIIFEESFLLVGETFFLIALLLAASSLFSRSFVPRDSVDLHLRVLKK